jgi:hypothetical protein
LHKDGSVPGLALARVLIDTANGASALDQELLDRATQLDYHAWLAGAVTANGCVRPIRLRGSIRDISPSTGEIVRTLDTESLPDGVLYIPCGDRRASVCPACSETYRRDTYHLIRAGLTGGKGVPETIGAHPCVFATFTAPSLGPVHTRNARPDGRTVRCRPRRKSTTCLHGRRMSCGRRHAESDTSLGRPLCADCYDYNAAVVWNVHASELWRRTTIAIRRHLARTARVYRAGTVQLSYAKVAEFHAAWHLGSHNHPDFQALRRWAHMLGYRGHFATKSRRYSTTLKALRQARADYHRRQHPSLTSDPGDDAVITVTTLQRAGTGRRSSGDALLALSAAARARDHERAARDEAQVP